MIISHSFSLNLPKISIVTPSFNQGQFLEETIRSVLQQEYQNLEYIIIDGGSTDDSLAIIEKYAPQLTYWESEKDQGQSHAINKGWRKSTGDLLAWLNSDDVLMPGALMEVADIWQQESHLGFVSGITARINADGEPVGKPFGEKFDMTQSLISSRNPIAQASTFISRAALEHVGMLDESLHMSMDWDLWLRIGCAFPVKFVPRIWSQTRHWANTKTASNLLSSGEEHAYIVRKLFSSEDCMLPDRLRHQALAAAYGRMAVLHEQEGEFQSTRKFLLRSLWYCPSLKGGPAEKVLPKAFWFVRVYRSMVRLIKRVYQRIRLILGHDGKNGSPK